MLSRILVTGGAGFIGSAVVRHAVGSCEHTVLVVDKLTYAGDLESLAPVAHAPGYSFVRADIVDASKMRGVIESFEPDAIMHLAAESHVDRSIDGPAAFIETNIVGTFTLLQASFDYWRRLPSGKKKTPSASTTFRPMKCSGRWTGMPAILLRPHRIAQTRRMRHRKRHPTTSCGRGIPPMAYPP